MNLTESKLSKIIKESVKRILRESEIGDKVQSLRKQSRTYRPDECGDENCLSKTWNRGMGIQSFIEVLPDEGVVLYNALTTGKRDLERIKKTFPGYKFIKVDKPYWSTAHLRHSFPTND